MVTHGAPSRRVRRLRTGALALLVVAGCVNYMDRSAVAVANGPIRDSLGLSLGEMGLLLSSFAWAYGFAQLPAGMLVDRFGPRRVLGVGLVLWSLAQVGSAFSRSLAGFTMARVALGLGESPMYTGGTRVCADWYAERERTMPVAVFNASASLGPAIAPAILTGLMAAYGWRTMFVAIGAAGVLVAVAWVLLYRGPDAAGLSPAERAAISDEPRDAVPPRAVSSEPAGAAGVPVGAAAGAGRHAASRAPLRDVRQLLQQRTSWGMALGFSGVIYMTWLFATWLPGYLQTQRHLDATAAGLLSSIPLAAGFLGALAGGWVASRLGRAGMDPREACRWPVILAMLGTAGFTVAGALAPGVAGSLALLSGGVFLANLASSCGWALGAVMAPPAEVGTLEAIQNVGGSLGGALAPLVTGVVVQATGSFLPALFLAAAVSVGSAVAYATLVRAPVG
jgi:sugar phosphate permease